MTLHFLSTTRPACPVISILKWTELRNLPSWGIYFLDPTLADEYRYGCPRRDCKATFSDIREWELHERDHWPLRTEYWHCIQIDPKNERPCHERFWDEKSVCDHLAEIHSVPLDACGKQAEDLRLGGDKPLRSWCGFCHHFMDVSGKRPIWEESFDHLKGHDHQGKVPLEWIENGHLPGIMHIANERMAVGQTEGPH